MGSLGFKSRERDDEAGPSEMVSASEDPTSLQANAVLLEIVGVVAPLEDHVRRRIGVVRRPRKLFKSRQRKEEILAAVVDIWPNIVGAVRRIFRLPKLEGGEFSLVHEFEPDRPVRHEPI